MTDRELISSALGALSTEECEFFLVKRKGGVLLALPRGRDSATKALGLYQPQRLPAKLFAKVIQTAINLGIHKWLLPKMRVPENSCAPDPSTTGVVSGSQGILLGNPDHSVKRAIVSYDGGQGYEVAKMAFGPEGIALIKEESATIESLPKNTAGVPRLIGTDFSNNLGLMRMPYLDPCERGTSGFDDHVALLGNWLSDKDAIPLKDFPEWKGIEEVIRLEPGGEGAVERLGALGLVPAIRHGDYAPWNLTSDPYGKILALDWEWGCARGVPGFDLVHYLSQDARLVKRMDTETVISEVESQLKRAKCRGYLKLAGWNDNVRDLLIATAAYYKSRGFDGSGKMLSRLLHGMSKKKLS